MNSEYPESFVCAFCQDRYCIRDEGGRRITFLGKVLTETSGQPIIDCPKFRTIYDFVKGRTGEIPNPKV